MLIPWLLFSVHFSEMFSLANSTLLKIIFTNFLQNVFRYPLSVPHINLMPQLSYYLLAPFRPSGITVDEFISEDRWQSSFLIIILEWTDTFNNSICKSCSDS
jgi:hypothetical protein